MIISFTRGILYMKCSSLLLLIHRSFSGDRWNTSYRNFTDLIVTNTWTCFFVTKKVVFNFMLTLMSQSTFAIKNYLRACVNSLSQTSWIRLPYFSRTERNINAQHIIELICSHLNERFVRLEICCVNVFTCGKMYLSVIQRRLEPEDCHRPAGKHGVTCQSV